MPKFCDRPHGSSYQRIRGTSHREIADAANVGPSNIRNYFPGKEGLFRTVVQPVVGPAAVSDEGREISLEFSCAVLRRLIFYLSFRCATYPARITGHLKALRRGTAGAIRHFAARHRTQDVQASGAFQQSKRSGAAIAAPLRCRIVRMTAPRVFSNSTPHRRPVSWPDYPRSHRFSTPQRRRSYRIRGNRRDSPENRGNRRSSVPWQPCCRRPPPR